MHSYSFLMHELFCSFTHHQTLNLNRKTINWKGQGVNKKCRHQPSSFKWGDEKMNYSLDVCKNIIIATNLYKNESNKQLLHYSKLNKHLTKPGFLFNFLTLSKVPTDIWSNFAQYWPRLVFYFWQPNLYWKILIELKP